MRSFYNVYSTDLFPIQDVLKLVSPHTLEIDNDQEKIQLLGKHSKLYNPTLTSRLDIAEIR